MEQRATQYPSRNIRAEAYRRAVDGHAMVVMMDTQGAITFANEKFCEHYGFGRDELIGVSLEIIQSGVHDQAVFRSMWEALHQGRRWTGEICNRAKSGELCWVHCEVSPIFDHSDEIVGFVSVQRDVSSHKQAEQALRHREKFLQNVTEVSGVGGWSLEVETGTLYWSAHTKLIHEVPLDYEPNLSTAIEFYAPEARPVITSAVENALETGEGWDLELPLVTAKGRSIWVRAVGNATRENGMPKTLLGAFQDITERKLAQDKLFEEVASRHEAEQLLRDVIDAIPDAVAAYDENDNLLIFNEKYVETYEASREAITKGASFRSILEFGLKRGQYADGGDSEQEQAKWLKRRLRAHRNPPEAVTQQLLDGTWLQIREHKSATGSTVGVRTNVTSMKRAEAELRRFAEEDPLTGLFNRARFCAEVEALLDRQTTDRSSDHHCLALFDIDHFKPINDSYGHDVGDEVLKQIATRLRSVLRPDDFAARLGGDEFVFVLHGYASWAECGSVLGELFNAMNDPVQTCGLSLPVSLSLGAVPIEDAGLSVRELLHRADRGQYRAKEAGRARWCWFGSEESEEISRQEGLDGALRLAVSQPDMLDFPLQPIIDPLHGAPLGFSGEMRWTHEGVCYDTLALRKMASRATVSKPLCDRKLASLLQATGGLEQRGIGCGVLWITVGAEQLRLGELASAVRELCLEAQFPPENVLVAVEEKALRERSATAIHATLKLLKDAGVGLAVDGFGSAGASLQLLRELQIDAVRVSHHLLNGNTRGAYDADLAKAIVYSAKQLGVSTFVSDLHSQSDAQRVAELGVAGLQGPGVAAPIDQAELTTYLAAFAAKRLVMLAGEMSAARGTRADMDDGGRRVDSVQSAASAG